jgi:molybdopterin-guanine dinucleotide biosynthesis protein B
VSLLRVVSVVGFHGAGKTRVAEAIIRELVKRGYKVGAIKHVRDEDFSIDRPGKDTWRHARAGAEVIASLAPNEFATIEKRHVELEDAIARFEGLDFLIVEGFREFNEIARIIVARDEGEIKELAGDLSIACVGAPCPHLPSFKIDEIVELVDLVERKAFPLLPGVNCKQCGFESCGGFARAVLEGDAPWNGCVALKERLKLVVDRKKIPLKPFVQDFIAGAIEGMLSSLKGAKGREIELKVRKID